MAHSYHHAVSSARKFGGIPADYQAVHDLNYPLIPDAQTIR